jgi:hypothetical protein
MGFIDAFHVLVWNVRGSVYLNIVAHVSLRPGVGTDYTCIGTEFSIQLPIALLRLLFLTLLPSIILISWSGYRSRVNEHCGYVEFFGLTDNISCGLAIQCQKRYDCRNQISYLANLILKLLFPSVQDSMTIPIHKPDILSRDQMIQR